MKYQDLISAMKRFGSSEKDICMHGLGVSIEDVKDNVIIAPWWEPNVFKELGTEELLSVSNSKAVKLRYGM